MRGSLFHPAAGRAAPIVLRRLVPAAIVVPIVVVCLDLLGEREGLWGTTVAVAIVGVAMTALLVAIVAWAARVQDHTARVELEQQLRQSQKMDALGQLAGSVAHDFNNLVVAIKANGALALNRADGPAPEEAAPSIEKVLAAADHAAALSGRLLAFSRKRDVERAVLDLNAIVRETEELVAPLLGPIALETKLGPRAYVNAVPGELSQLLVNLVVNARDAIDGAGRVTISTAAVNGHVSLSVADTGCGMDEATVERIFEPFFTTKAAGEGTGLGLSTVFGVVESIGGQIEVESAVGAGTTFRISLPTA